MKPTPRKGRANLGDEVAAHIRDAILTGKVRAGERIDQDAIASQLGLSRLPVREALIALDREGLVTTIPRRGTYVQTLSPGDIADHYQIFGHVAGLAASRAAARATVGEIDQLRQLHDAMEATADQREAERLNFEFHRLVNVAGRSRRLTSLIHLLSQSLPAHFYEFAPHWHAQANRDHAEILEAIATGDRDAAAQAMAKHLTGSATHAVEVLTQRGFFDPASTPTDTPASTHPTPPVGTP